MQVLNSLVATIFLLAGAAVSAASGTTQAPDNLSFPHLFSVDFEATGGGDSIAIPGGHRVLLIITDGVMKVSNGTTIATVQPGGSSETGILHDDGTFVVDAHVIVKFTDGHFGFLQLAGNDILNPVTGDGQGFHRMQIETDSPEFSKYTSWFIVGQLLFSGTTGHIESYGADPAAL
ncbi:hypothetical protein BKA62DRAFT_708739 [Auriculariales sp. MPI-PUGE-AT-0066]|nr:hypothetical protein BKA62DRAFT_708739 [Auriculariales sp. MPI-PUGE-AT-0066]